MAPNSNLSRIKDHIPNFLTCCNIICGCIGTVQVFQGQILLGSTMIWAGAGFDFMDGLAARLLKAESKIGKELDSLADMITFSLLPSIILFQLIQDSDSAGWLPYIAFSVAVFSALRLANFNIDTRQTKVFIGLPTPANAVLISSLPFIVVQRGLFSEYLEQAYVLIGLTLVLSFLLVSNLELMTFKFQDFRWSDSKIEIIFWASSFILLVLLKAASIPIIVLLYVILSLLKRSITTH